MGSSYLRRRPRLRTVLFVLASAFAGVVLPGFFVAASAQTYGTVAPNISNSTPTPGSQVNFSASGFQPNSSTQVFFESTPVLLEQAQADANGTVASSATIPSDAVPGSHDIVVSGSAPDGSPLSVSIPITVVSATSSAPSTGGLAFTGANIALGAAVGFIAVGFGGFLLLSVRRKRHAIER